ncbi:MAG: hypothetical protein DRJ66_03735 [Thermoprotei archaeon]|nr:MAG: hypothetical protein DRJ66_03735 [Thermoprotei archaeon]
MTLWDVIYYLFTKWRTITIPTMIILSFIIVVFIVLTRKMSRLEQNFSSLFAEYLKSIKIISDGLGRSLSSTNVERIIERLERIERRVAPLPRRRYEVKEFARLDELARYFDAYSLTISSSEGLLVESTLKRSDAEIDAATVVELYEMCIKAFNRRAPILVLSDLDYGMVIGKIESLGLYFIMRTNVMNIYDHDYLYSFFKSISAYLERKYMSLRES